MTFERKVLDKLDNIEGDVKDHSQRITRLENVRIADIERISQNATEIAKLNVKIDQLPSKIAATMSGEIFKLIDQRNLFYMRTTGRRVLAIVGLIFTAMCGAAGMKIFEALFS